jgi:hypothetical protein
MFLAVAIQLEGEGGCERDDLSFPTPNSFQFSCSMYHFFYEVTTILVWFPCDLIDNTMMTDDGELIETEVLTSK